MDAKESQIGKSSDFPMEDLNYLLLEMSPLLKITKYKKKQIMVESHRKNIYLDT